MAKKRKKKRRSAARVGESASAAPAGEPAPPTALADDQAPDPQPAPSGPAADGIPRAGANAIIALFLLFAVAMPARYYLSGGGLDERFAWRMFSTIRQYKCKVALSERRGGEGDHELVKLGSAVHVAWVNMLKRGRPAVGEKLLRTRCDAGEDTSAVQLRRSCRTPDGTVLPVAIYTIDCASGEIEEHEEASL